MPGLRVPSGAIIRDVRDRLLRFCVKEYPYYDAIPSVDPNHIDPIDVLVTVAMNSRIDTAVKVRTTHRGLERECAPFLAQIPFDATLLSDDLALKNAQDLLHAAVQVPYVGVSVATKVLHRKRPSLIPMLDKVVINYYLKSLGKLDLLSALESDDKSRAVGVGIKAWEAFREDLRAVRNPIEILRQELLTVNFRLSTVRILELLIWMEAEERGYYPASDNVG